MSNYFAPVHHPIEKVIRAAFWIDDYFGNHKYGVRFDPDGPVFKPSEVDIPTGAEFPSALVAVMKKERMECPK